MPKPFYLATAGSIAQHRKEHSDMKEFEIELSLQSSFAFEDII